jgi:hypothetical protein
MRPLPWSALRRLPVDRSLASATLRLGLIAAAISAAKIAFFTVGGSALIERAGVEALPLFYIGLALVAGPLALWVATGAQHRNPALALSRTVLAAAAAGPVAAGLLGLDLPGAAIFLLGLAHLFNILTEILLWLVAARWFPAPELRRTTAWVFLAYALGGFAGGMLTQALLVLGDVPACALVVVAGSLGAAWGLRHSRRLPRQGGLREATEPETPTPIGTWPALRAFAGLCRRYPLALLIALASFLLTTVYVLTEFLCFSVYAGLLTGRGSSAAFFAALYAWGQALEFAIVLLAAGPVTRRLSPVARNVLFPLGSLSTLLWMGQNQGLTATVAAHLHAEAVSNGLFDPVHNANFAALPTATHPITRAVSEGVLYPAGMAAGGLLLLWVGQGPSLAPTLALAQATALLFAVLGVLIGVQIVPALLTSLGRFSEQRGPIRRGDVRAAVRSLAPTARRLRSRLVLLAQSCPPERRQRIQAINRRSLQTALARSAELDPSGTVRLLARRLEDPDPDTRAMAVEALLSLPVRPVLLPFLPVLQTLYLPAPTRPANDNPRDWARAAAEVRRPS